MRLRKTAIAEQDLSGIWNYIARTTPPPQTHCCTDLAIASNH